MPRNEPLELGKESIEEHIDVLSEWVDGQSQLPHFKDRRFLLSFLRTCKFDQNDAQKRLKKYWTSRKSGIMKLMNDIDPSSDAILSILRGQNAVYVPLPGVDKDGRRVIMAKWNQLDVSGKSYSFEEWFRAITVVFDALCMLDEDAMENGVTFLMDANQVTMKHLTFFGFGNSMKQFAVMQKGYPIKIKKVHYINNNAAIDVFFNMVKIVISSKLSERIQLHGYSLIPVYDNIGMGNLPEEYLPDDYDGPTAGSPQDIMETFIENSILQPDNLRALRQLYGCTRTTPISLGSPEAERPDDPTNESDCEDIEDMNEKLQEFKLN